ncbi:MAG: ribose 5-phosphate isomerase B [Saprospiraceae bacterium]
MKIAVGSDHAGYAYKEYIKTYLLSNGYEVIDFGPKVPDSVDYADFAHPVALSVITKDADLGILVCGSGNGVCMTANKHQGIRAALCWTTELGALARQHNDANILCLPERFISKRMASRIVHAFLTSTFEGGRHQRRVDKISC